jgi:hypothetical protein
VGCGEVNESRLVYGVLDIDYHVRAFVTTP